MKIKDLYDKQKHSESAYFCQDPNPFLVLLSAVVSKSTRRAKVTTPPILLMRAMIKSTLQNSWIQTVIWIHTRIEASVPCAIVNIHFLEILARYVHNVLSYFAKQREGQTDKQTKNVCCQNIYSLTQKNSFKIPGSKMVLSPNYVRPIPTYCGNFM